MKKHPKSQNHDLLKAKSPKSVKRTKRATKFVFKMPAQIEKELRGQMSEPKIWKSRAGTVYLVDVLAR